MIPLPQFGSPPPESAISLLVHGGDAPGHGIGVGPDKAVEMQPSEELLAAMGIPLSRRSLGEPEVTDPEIIESARVFDSVIADEVSAASVATARSGLR